MTRFSSNGLAMSVADRLTRETGIKHVAVFSPRGFLDGLFDRTPFEVRREA